MRDVLWSMLMGFMIAVWCFNSPWSDNTKYREAVHECEKSLPRDQHCKVIGVPE
jgi:hypothetical protein